MSRKIFQIDRNTRKASVYGYGIDSKDISYSFSIDDGNDYMLFARYSDGTAAHVYPIGYIQWYEQESTWKFVKGFGSETFSGMIIGKRSLSSRTIDCSISDSDAGDDILNTSRISLGLTRWYMRYGIEVEEEGGVKRLSVASVLSTDDEDIRRIYHSDDGTGIYDVETGEFGRLFRGGKLFNLYSVVNQTKGITKSIEDGDDPSVWYSDEWSDGDTVEFCVTPDGNGSEKAWIRRIVDGRADGIYLLENDDVDLYFSGNVVADGTFRTGNVESISVFGDPGIYGYIPAGTKLKSIAFLQILLSRANDPSCSLTQAHEYISGFVDESSSPFIVKKDISIGFDPSDNSAKKIPLSNYKNYSTRIAETFSKVTDDIEAPYVSTSWPPGKDTPSTLLDGIIAFFNFENEKIYDVVNGEEYTNATSYSPTFVDKKTGKALKTYSGSSFTSAVATGGSVKEVPTKITISFWIDMSEMDTNPYTNFIVQYGNDTSVCIYGNSDGSIRFKAGNFYGYWYTTAQKNKMTHFCVVADSDEKYIQWYIDGVAKPKSTYAWKTSTQPGQSIKLNFGGKHVVDEVGIWDRCLTAEEVTELYEDGYNGLTYPFDRKGQDSLVDGIIDFWNFDEDSIGVTGRNPMTLNTFSMDTGRVGAGLGCHTSTAQRGASVAKIQSTDDKWSLAFWFKGPVRDGVWSGFAVDQTTPITNPLFTCRPDGKWFLDAPSSPADGQSHFIPTAVSESEWQHYAVTSNGTNIKGYCNGELLMDYDLESPTVFSLKNIMGNDTYNTWSPGIGTKIDEIGFWDRTLTDNEVHRLYSYGLKGVSYPFKNNEKSSLLGGIVAFYPFNGDLKNAAAPSVRELSLINGTLENSGGVSGGMVTASGNFNRTFAENTDWVIGKSFTISLWTALKNQDWRGIGDELSDGRTGPCHRASMIFSNTNRLQTEILSSGSIQSKGVIDKDALTHVAMTCDDSTRKFRMYISGELDTEVDFSSEQSAKLRMSYIFGHKGSYYGFGLYGKMDDFGVWDRALSGDEIRNLYRYGLNEMTYPFDKELPPVPTPECFLDGLEYFIGFSNGNVVDHGGEYSINIPSGFYIDPVGMAGKCMSNNFDGNVEMESNVEYSTQHEKMTFAYWGKYEGDSSHYICQKAFHGVDICLSGDKFFITTWKGTTPTYNYLKTDLSSGQWHHMCVVITPDPAHPASSGCDCFFDGAFVGHLSGSNFNPTTSSRIRIDGWGKGSYDEVGYWSRGFSREEVALLYKIGLKGMTYPFDREPTPIPPEPTPVPPSPQSSLLEGLDAFWDFSDGSLSSSVGTRTLEGAVNVPTVNNDGRVGDCIEFDGTTGTFLIDKSKKYAADIDSFTLSAWVQMTRIKSGATCIVSLQGYNDSGESSGYSIELDSGRYMRIGTQGPWISTRLNDCNDAGWHHVVLAKSGNDFSAFFDGTKVWTSSSVSSVIYDGYLTIGGYSKATPTSYLGEIRAKIDEVGVWTRALSDEEVDQLYQRGKKDSTYPWDKSIGSSLLDGILAFYPFDVDEMSQTVSLASAVDGNEAAIHRRGQPYSGAISGSEGVAGTGIGQIEDSSYHDDIWMHPFVTTESSDMTVSAWFNNACGGAKTDLFAVWGISSSSWKFKAGYPSLSDATKIHTSYHTGSGESPIADGIVKKGWNHFCATIKAGHGVSFYINGVLVREQLSTGTVGLTANDLIEVELGTAYGPYFADEVGVWNRALTVNEIKELYKCGLDGISYPFERPDPASMPMMASFSLGPETDGESFAEEEQPTTISATTETSETGPEPENSQQQEPEWVPPPQVQYEDESDQKFNTMLVDSEPYEAPDQLSV